MSVAPLQLSGGGEDAPQSKLKVRPYRLRRYAFPPDYSLQMWLADLALTIVFESFLLHSIQVIDSNGIFCRYLPTLPCPS